MINACWNGNEVSAEILASLSVFGFREQTRWWNVLKCGVRTVARETGAVHFFWSLNKFVYLL